MCGQIGRLETMEAEEIYMNQEAKMQAAASKDKQRGTPANKKGVNDPDYENITLTFKNRDQPKVNHSPPKNQVPARSRPSSDYAQAPHWLQKAIMSLYILLAILCIVLLIWVLVKNSEMSQELLVLKRELWNVSFSAQECQEEQEQGWSKVQQSIRDAKGSIDTVKSNVQTWKDNLKTLPADISKIKGQLQKISDMLEKMPKQCKLGPGEVEAWIWPWLVSQGCGEICLILGLYLLQSLQLNKREDMEVLVAAWRMQWYFPVKMEHGSPGPSFHI